MCDFAKWTAPEVHPPGLASPPRKRVKFIQSFTKPPEKMVGMAPSLWMVAEFIRRLGYNAIPAANDTALSIPLAVDAGLGQAGRHGLLINLKVGARCRISKIFTDLPLEPAGAVD